MLAIFSEVHTYYYSDKKTQSMKVESNGAPKSGNDLWRSSVSIAAKCKSSQAYMLLVLWLGTKRGIWWGRFFLTKKPLFCISLMNAQKIGGTYTAFKIWSLLWIYWQILNVFLAVLTTRKISVSQNLNPPIAFLRIFLFSSSPCYVETKHKPHQISDFVTFFFSVVFFLKLINHYLMWEFLMRWGNISIKHTYHGT